MITSRKELIQYRESCKKAFESQKKKILVCSETGCVAVGALEIFDTLKKVLDKKGVDCALEMGAELHEHSVGVKKCGCLGFCELGPLVRIEPQGWLYIRVKPEDCEEIVEKTIVQGELVERLAYQRNEKTYPKQEEIPFYHKQTRLVRSNCGHTDSLSIQDYIAKGGYAATEKALFDMTPDEIVETISSSNLRGRGGGGYPTGRKWSQVRAEKEPVKYIVCNGDEGDPGAFMDRSIMEGDPHRMLEGMIIAAIGVGAHEGYIYVRAEYPLAIQHLQDAIEKATEAGLLGTNILGSGFDFVIHINQGAGAFVCGEGSALTASIEGHRGMPRTKPPRTVKHGLYAKPTVLNNVETFANVPLIILNGADWYKSIGPENSPGTKVFALTGNIQNTGLIEVPMGTTLREIVFEIGGGVKDGKEFKAVQIGGPSGGCLTKEHLDLPLDFDSLKKAGAMVGSGGLVVMDEDTCMVEVARFFMNFTQNESCGKCVPCREGTKRMLDILERITQGHGTLEDIDMLEELAATISSTALCGLGKTAPSPVVSTIKYFRDEYVAHVVDKKCPSKTCQALRTFVIDPELCKGCSKCTRQCPSGAIAGKVKEPFTIDAQKCVKCGSCLNACAFGAIKEVY
ncbi:MAG: NADH-quinone oxidoreductase subunit NuoF [Bacillota bacterium]